MGAAARVEAVRLADEIRRTGAGCVMGLGPRSLKAQMKQANNQGARFAFILGEDEVAGGTVTVRDLANSQQWQEPRHAALQRLLSVER
jgi:histidyl-tRNA synthetase